MLRRRFEPRDPHVTAADDPTFPRPDGSYPITVAAPIEPGGALDELARGAIGGDKRALDHLLRELEPLVTRTARLIVGSGSWAAEDAAQEALMDLARGIERLREPRAAGAWALRVATTRALKVAARERLVALRRATLDDVEVVSDPTDERGAAVKDAFDRLPPGLRATAVLRLYVGLSESETATVLGCSVGTVKSNLHDARRKLTATLVERGFAPTVAPRRAEDIA
jgi:RNA polymerase sigma factor (sigma-70 family)